VEDWPENFRRRRHRREYGQRISQIPAKSSSYEPVCLEKPYTAKNTPWLREKGTKLTGEETTVSIEEDLRRGEHHWERCKIKEETWGKGAEEDHHRVGGGGAP